MSAAPYRRDRNSHIQAGSRRKQLPYSRVDAPACGAPMEAKSRMPPILPQHKIVVTAALRPNERAYRKAIHKGTTPDTLYGPVGTATDADLVPKHGMVGMFVQRAGGSTRTSLPNATPLHVVTNTNGLPRDVLLTRPCFIQGDAHSGNQQVTTAIHGTDTIINYNDKPWSAFDPLYVDPFPLVNAETGLPIVYGPGGVEASVQNFRLRSGPPVKMHAELVEQQRALFNYVRNKQLNGKAEAMVEVLQKEATSGKEMLRVICAWVAAFFKEEMNVPIHDPIRAYLELWLTHTLANHLAIFAADSAALSGDYSFRALQALVLILRKAEQTNMEVQVKFDSALPADIVGTRSQQAGGMAHALMHDARVTRFLEADTIAAVSCEDLLVVDKMCNLLAVSQLDIARERRRDYLERYRFGIALGTTAPRENGDVFFF